MSAAATPRPSRTLRLLVVASVALPLLVLAGSGLVAFRTVVESTKGDMLRDMLVAESEASAAFAVYQLIAGQVASILGNASAEAIERQEQSLHARLAQAIEKAPQVQAVLVLDSAAHPLVSSRTYPINHRLDFADRQFFQALRSGREATYLGTIVIGRLDGQPHFIFARRRETTAGRFDGVIAVAVSPDYFRAFYDKLLLGNRAITAGLFREDGAVLARYPAPAAEERAAPPHDLLMAAIADNPQGGFFRGRAGPDGREQLIAYRKVPSYPVYVAEERSWASVLAAWRRLMSTHLIFGIPATLGLLMLSLLAFRRSQREQAALAKAREAIRQREEAEDALRQSQKMEAVGQLSGGIAHDFNNLLGVIIWNLEMLQRRLRDDDPRLRRPIEMAMKGAARAATLTQRLLAFSRRQPLEPKPVNPNRLVAGMSDLLRSTLGERIAIETVLAGGLWWVAVDTSELEAALLNLAVNARDAMPGGGKLTIETENAHLDEAYAATNGGEIVAGQYVLIAVSDTGVGMSKEIIAKAFEPFFTTKEVGQGTGLGLSQVYGFVKQSGGHVKIYSEPGQGTTVKLYLPRLAGEAPAAEPPTRAASASGDAARETILVVEDDEDLRASTVEALVEVGYRVLEAADGPAALRVLDAAPEIDLLFTDVGLPGGLNGRQLADEALRRRPQLKVLFTTGYARNAIVHQGRLDPGVELIVKPFTYAGLAARIRSVLEGKGAARS
ncbi:MAG TPA: ATP-binding protein [Alphaproteobacteria bacterium]|nr:ATP-binding protein [Alphaproteobacteria bacterium]